MNLFQSKPMIALSLLLGLSMMGCTANNVTELLGQAAGSTVDTEVAYGVMQCKYLRGRCIHGDFQEWQTSNKQLGCSCKE